MYRVTTPTHTFGLPADTSGYSVILVTYSQGRHVINKEYANNTTPSGMVLDGTDVLITLTQAETKELEQGTVQVQVRALSNGGKSYASQIWNVDVDPVLNEDILA